jgi:hypothetical protein
MTWYFEESDPMGGAAGEAFANTLKSPGMYPEHVLAREAIQNSVDAGLEDEKVLVRFRSKLISGAQKTKFVDAAGLADIADRLERLDLQTPNCLHTLGKPKTALPLLYVEDHHAEGLSGDPHDKGSNFYRLLLSLGDRSKARTARGSGGSYGFGKCVYSSSSAIQTIYAYTRFKNGKGGETTRIFGCGYYRSHEHGKKSYSGRAWQGAKRGGLFSGRTVYDPVENAEADKLAARLGFARRDAGDLGTTILIVDASVKLDEVVRGVEDWWWPRLIENKLDVEVFDPSGEMTTPRPKKSDQLRPFIEAFDLCRGRAEPKSGAQKVHALQRLGDLSLGVCGMVVVPEGQNGAPLVEHDRCNTVALIRAPLMVVAYKPFSETAPLVVGAFLAADDVDGPLKKSEPPAHDRWDPDSANLGSGEGSEREAVKAVLSRIKGGLKRFQSEAAPPTPAKQRRLSQLERALGAYFKPHGSGPGPHPEPGSSSLHLEFTKQPYAEATDDGMLRLRSVFTVSIDPQAEDDSVKLRLLARCPILEDEDQEGDDLPLNVSVKGVDADADEDDARLFRFLLAKGEKARFSVQSEPYDPAWTVRLRPEIDAEDAQ